MILTFEFCLSDNLLGPFVWSYLKGQNYRNTNLAEKVPQTLHSKEFIKSFHTQKIAQFFDENVKTDLSIYDPVSIFDQIFLIAQIIFHGDPTFVLYTYLSKIIKKSGYRLKSQVTLKKETNVTIKKGRVIE